jgi:5-hydroxyisourate hydrolase-like protein (transthyretin family)
LLLTLPALAAGTITGVVTNKTTNKPAAGDDVVLIRLAQGMQESTRTKTDSKGRFSLDVPDTGLHLVRVTHEKANYFRPAPPGTESVEVEVFNSAAKVKGVSVEANLFRIQTDGSGNGLHVVENFFVKNESQPQLTQFSDRSFEFTLPDGAVIEGSAALGPGGMPVQSPPVPLSEKGHYAFVFPVRPGQTRFQLSYRLPYNGSMHFTPLATLPTDTVVVIMAKSMKFDASGSPFSPITDEVDAQTYVARSIPAGGSAAFTVSGSGSLPRQTDTNGQATGQDAGDAPAGAPGAAPAAGAAENKPGGGMADPINTPDPLTKYKWWIIAGIALLLAVGAGVILRTPGTTVQPVSGTPSAPLPLQASPGAQPGATIESVLRDELFSLETDRLSNRITEEEYAQQREALDRVMRRALTRGKTHPSAG